jgi:hypothetical protein
METSKTGFIIFGVKIYIYSIIMHVYGASTVHMADCLSDDRTVTMSIV